MMKTADGKDAAWCAACRHLIVLEAEGWYHFSIDDWCDECACYCSRLKCDPDRGQPERLLPPRPRSIGPAPAAWRQDESWWRSPTGVYTRVFKRAKENS